MKLKEIITILGDKYSNKEITKAMNQISPADFKAGMRKDNGKTNVIIELIKKKLKKETK